MIKDLISYSILSGTEVCVGLYGGLREIRIWPWCILKRPKLPPPRYDLQVSYWV